MWVGRDFGIRGTHRKPPFLGFLSPGRTGHGFKGISQHLPETLDWRFYFCNRWLQSVVNRWLQSVVLLSLQLQSAIAIGDYSRSRIFAICNQRLQSGKMAWNGHDKSANAIEWHPKMWGWLGSGQSAIDDCNRDRRSQATAIDDCNRWLQSMIAIRLQSGLW